jgi:hypothetical protein
VSVDLSACDAEEGAAVMSVEEGPGRAQIGRPARNARRDRAARNGVSDAPMHATEEKNPDERDLPGRAPLAGWSPP